MPIKKKVTEEPKPILYPREDRQRIEYLRKIATSNQQEMDDIFRFYNKYVGHAPNYNTTCDCHNSIQNLYWLLLAWFSANLDKFETDDIL